MEKDLTVRISNFFSRFKLRGVCSNNDYDISETNSPLFLLVLKTYTKMSGAAALQKDRNFLAVIGDEVTIELK